jgi:Ca-activated chloride channel homolog
VVYEYFNDISFGNKWAFGLLGLLPIMAFWYFKKTTTAQLPISTLGASNLSSIKSKLAHLPFFLRLLTIALIIIAIARPQKKYSNSNAEGNGIDIMLCLDVSGSMGYPDFAPTRLEAAKAVAVNFVSQRVTDKIGMVIFAGESFTQCPLTGDHDIVKVSIENIRGGVMTDGTAIGDGLATSVDRLRNSKTATKIIVLLTDGENNGGLIDPKAAKEIAKQFGIKVYTIGVGTNGTIKVPVETPLGGTEVREIKVSIDDKLLTEIATETGGKYFRAKDNEELKQIYDNIDKLEKSKIEIQKTIQFEEQFFPFALAAAISLLLEILLRYLVFRKFP